jgi:hypothetical protein
MVPLLAAVASLASLALALAQEVRQTGKLFTLGPGKTATHTLGAMFEARGRVGCHFRCNGILWPEESDKRRQARRRPSSKIWRSFDAYSDRGEKADFVWLDAVMPDARFLLSSRPLHSWLRSTLDHFARVSRMHKNWTDDQILDWVSKAAAHQDRVTRYFNQTVSRRARFAMVDVEAMAGSDVEQIVDWIIRPESRESVPDRLVLSAADLPRSSRTGVEGKIPDAYSHKANAAKSSIRIGQLLERAGCAPESWRDSLYARCAANVSAYKLRNPGAQSE